MRSLSRLLAGSRSRSASPAAPDRRSTRTAAVEGSNGPVEGIPPWVISSVMAFLGPFASNRGLVSRSYSGGAAAPGDAHRDFLLEVERNTRIQLDWSNGRVSADRSLAHVIQTDNDKLVQVLDFALKNVELGYSYFDVQEAPRALDRALTEAGSVWSVAGDARNGYALQRRVTEAGDALARQVQAPAGNAAEELRTAYDKAYGRHPDPGAAYRHAVKAVEAATIPVVSPSNPTATLGTLIADIRNKPQKFSAIFARNARKVGPSGDDLAPVEVVLGLMDALWNNQTDRHAPGDTQPATPVSQEQAEWAVHTASLLVQTFRAGWIQ